MSNTPSRAWYVSPIRVAPGAGVPGTDRVTHYFGHYYHTYIGPNPTEMKKLRGPFETCGAAIKAARVWREVDQKRSKLYLVLTVNGISQHCNRYKANQAGKALARKCA